MKYLQLTFLIFLITIPVRAATLRGTVEDAMSAAIPNAHVIIHWDSVGLEGVKENVGLKDDAITTTDATGHFSLELPPGVYDVFVTAAGFGPSCEKIFLKIKEIRPFVVRLKVTRMLTVVVD